MAVSPVGSAAESVGPPGDADAALSAISAMRGELARLGSMARVGLMAKSERAVRLHQRLIAKFNAELEAGELTAERSQMLMRMMESVTAYMAETWGVVASESGDSQAAQTQSELEGARQTLAQTRMRLYAPNPRPALDVALRAKVHSMVAYRGRGRRDARPAGRGCGAHRKPSGGDDPPHLGDEVPARRLSQRSSGVDQAAPTSREAIPPTDRATEAALVAAEWPMLSPIQRVQRAAMGELTKAEEWRTLASIFERRGLMLEMGEAA